MQKGTTKYITRSFVDVPGIGSVIEARVDKEGLGVTTLMQNANRNDQSRRRGSSWGRIRRLITDDGLQVQSAGPSTSIQVSTSGRSMFPPLTLDGIFSYR